MTDITIPLLAIPDLPFCIGALPQPHNPSPLPDTHPIELQANLALGRLDMHDAPGLANLLSTAYALGVEMGTPSDDTPLGRPYVADFLEFIDRVTPRRGRALEIGAGVGYMSRLLRETGWRVDSIEPGRGYERHWERHGVRVINDFFPTADAKGPYDLIVFYTVLEHILDVSGFLAAVADHLGTGGRVVLAVPDCTTEIEKGDPSILLHEHYHYFTASSLSRSLEAAGFRAQVERSGYGRSLYAVAELRDKRARQEHATQQPDQAPLLAFGERVERQREGFRLRLERASNEGSVGIYCPSRALALLPQGTTARFFDDDPGVQGKFYPPFAMAVESRDALIQDPVRTLFVMSRTFGSRLTRALEPHLPHTTVILPDDFADA